MLMVMMNGYWICEARAIDMHFDMMVDIFFGHLEDANIKWEYKEIS